MVPTVFWGKLACQGREELSFEMSPNALILMGDWCGPTIRHRMKRKQGRVTERSRCQRLEEKEIEKFISRERLCLLDLPANG